jgi:hypothetical protein
MGTGVIFWGYSSWVLNLTTHFYLELRLKMNGNVLLIPLDAVVIWMRNALPLFCPGVRAVSSACPNEHKLLRGLN